MAERMDLRERVRRVPGMERLLPRSEGLPRAYLVGGAVRDLVRAEIGRLTSTSYRGCAARRRGPSQSGSAARREYERFGTAGVVLPGQTLHLATTRSEVYDAAGELPRATQTTSLRTIFVAATSR